MNDNVALLNPAVESDVCRRMMDVTRSQLEKLEQALTGSVLDRDQYLLKIGALSEVRRVLDRQEELYKREFEI